MNNRLTKKIIMNSIRLTGVALVLAVAAHAESPMRAEYDEPTGLVTVADAGKPVFLYHYKNVPVPAEHSDNVTPASKYAVSRSNYIHPLYGLDGASLTSDWNKDFPHHRGIYWAWPEVGYKGETGDVHALQRVWARPTGKIATRSGEGWAEIEAENRWMWEDKTPVVLETAIIRAWQSGDHGRWLDLTLRFEALEDGITLARRGTKNYGGLNLRMARMEDMRLLHHAEPEGASPRAAWQLASGRWPGAAGPSSITVFEKSTNPGYPADYIEYPDLPWFQPAFPHAGTRHALEKSKPLTLQYRFWIRNGAPPAEQELREQWNLYHNQKKP
jgi:hypothetical protein